MLTEEPSPHQCVLEACQIQNSVVLTLCSKVFTSASQFVTFTNTQFPLSIFEMFDFRHKSHLLFPPVLHCNALWQNWAAGHSGQYSHIPTFLQVCTTNRSSPTFCTSKHICICVAFDTGAPSPNSSRAVLHYNSIGRATSSALMAGARVSISTPPPPYVAANICK